MRVRKTKSEGRLERERLIDRQWPGQRARLRETIRGEDFAADDLNDAFAALWSACRIEEEHARPFPGDATERDSRGLPMQILA
jgi:predicted RNase H-like nuclease